MTTASADLLEIARNVAVRAGTLIRQRREEGVEVADRKSSPVDIVTHADREAETLIRSLLSEARPSDGFLGEESGAEVGSSGLTWIVDPIDGTVNFLYGIPQYAVSVAVVEGEPDPLTWTGLAGCVFNPAIDELYSATADGAAYLGTAFRGEGEIRVADAVPLDYALIATGFAYDSGQRARQGAIVAGLLPEVRDIRRVGTASLDLCFVASGRFNAYFERGLSPWDHAAGAIIARSAGARVSGLAGMAPNREFILAGHPDVAAHLERRLIALGA